MDLLSFDVETLFAGGRLCLDFINTSCQRRGVNLEFIGSGDELRQWLYLAESVIGQPLCPDEKVWSTDYVKSVLPQAIELRTALHDLVQSVIEKTPTPVDTMVIVNSVLRANPVYSQIRGSDEGFGEAITVSFPDKKWMVAIAQDAVDLLCHSDLSLLRQCECVSCVRVFYDTTKNHKRRWCVEKCSSQTKAAAYYRRKKAKIEIARAISESDR